MYGSPASVHCGYSSHHEPFRHFYRNGLDLYIIRLQAEGSSQALIDGKSVNILPGDLLLFKPGDLYDLRIGEEGQPVGKNGDYFVMCSGGDVETWWRKKERPVKTRVAEDGRLKAVWQQLILEKSRMNGGDPELVDLLLRTLFLLIDRAIGEAPSASPAAAYHALKIRSYIEEHAAAGVRLDEAASHAGLSVSRAVHLFKEQFGISMMQYALQVRLSRAVELLLYSPMTLEHIAAETGFGTYTYLHRVFRERYGVSPGVYRKQRMA